MYLHYVRNGFEKFNEFRVAIIGDSTLTAKVVMILGDKFGERQAAVRRVLQKINNLPADESR